MHQVRYFLFWLVLAVIVVVVANLFFDACCRCEGEVDRRNLQPSTDHRQQVKKSSAIETKLAWNEPAGLKPKYQYARCTGIRFRVQGFIHSATDVPYHYNGYKPNCHFFMWQNISPSLYEFHRNQSICGEWADMYFDRFSTMRASIAHSVRYSA